MLVLLCNANTRSTVTVSSAHSVDGTSKVCTGWLCTRSAPTQVGTGQENANRMTKALLGEREAVDFDEPKEADVLEQVTLIDIESNIAFAIESKYGDEQIVQAIVSGLKRGGRPVFNRFMGLLELQK